jgi:AcrR family transcriptional regulator
MEIKPGLGAVNTVVYGDRIMADQLSAQDWLDRGLKTLASRGFSALKAAPLAKEMGVSRGSFYWHFADIAAYHAAILNHWREVATDAIIANVEQAAGDGEPLAVLLRRVFSERLALERAVRSWAAFDSAARSAVQAIDRRRFDYVEGLIRAKGIAPEIARARAQILYWAFLGYALSDHSPRRPEADPIIEELVRMAGR